MHKEVVYGSNTVLHADSDDVISLPRQVSACPGEQLKLACAINQTIVLWVIVHSKQNIILNIVANTGNTIATPTMETFNGTDEVTFNFEVTSEANTLPLTTELCANNATSTCMALQIIAC